MQQLEWGHRYLSVSPEQFRIDYQINPFMNVLCPPDPELARAQWNAMLAALRAEGAEVEVLAARADSPDMVYAQNLGFVYRQGGERGAVLSRMRFPQRRREGIDARAWFEADGSPVHELPEPLIFEAGDAFWWRGGLVVGCGPRTDAAAVPELGRRLGVPALPVRIAHPAMFHLDLAFCPVTADAALVAFEAFDDASAERLRALIPDPIELTLEEALGFAANVVVVGDVVIGDGLTPRIRTELAARGLGVRAVELSQFRLAGGSIRCLTNPLDIVLG